MAGLGLARRGQAGRGKTRHGTASLSWAWQGSPYAACRGSTVLDVAGLDAAGRGVTRLGKTGRGESRLP